MSKQLGEIIKKYRLQRNLSVRGLASMMFLSPSTVSRWETGSREPDLDTLFLIAEHLRINPSLLLSAKTEHDTGRRINLLVVEDDADELKHLVSEIKKMLPEHSIRGFQTTKEALKYEKSHTCDIAFIDLKRIKERGITLAKKLTEIYPPTNIIFLSDKPDHMEKAWKLHASGYLLVQPDRAGIRDELTHLRYPVWGLQI